jgi:predicted PurR-regulated permease PerM
MNLKTLISLKFVLYVIGYFSLFYFITNITRNYSKLEDQNKVLIEQKECYEKILDLGEDDLQDKKILYSIIDATNSRLELESEKSKLSLNTNILIIILLSVFLYYVFNYLNTKIEKLKSQETESEREKFL